MKASHVSHSHDDSEAWEGGTFLEGRIEIVLFSKYLREETPIGIDSGGKEWEVITSHQKVKGQQIYY